MRRTSQQARSVILDAAERLLADQGLAAVQVRAVAQSIGMTDAGVNHHFGTREGLLTALIEHGGARMRARIEKVVREWTDQPSIAPLLTELAMLYRDGYGELGVALHAAGWRSTDPPLLGPVAEALHRARAPGSDIAETRHVVAAFHQALALDPSYGAPFRLAAGLGKASKDADQHLRWWIAATARLLALPS